MKYALPRYRVRLVREKRCKYSVNTPSIAVDVLRQLCCSERGDREVLSIVYCNNQLNPVGCEVVAVGGLGSCGVTASDVLRGAVLSAATGIILGHNHPSGSVKPSQSDIDFTKRVKNAAEILGIKLLDHIVLTEDEHVSMHEAGFI